MNLLLVLRVSPLKGGDVLGDIWINQIYQLCKHGQAEPSRQMEQVWQKSKDSNELGIFDDHSKIKLTGI